MTKHIALAAALVALSACGDDSDDRFRRAADEPGTTEAQAEATGDRDGPTPAVTFGDELRVRATSPMLDGEQNQRYLSDGNGAWIRADDGESGIYEALSHCTEPSERTVLYWTGGTEPTIRIHGQGLSKVFWPGEEPGEWIGEISPASDTTPACELALDKAGLSWPIEARLHIENPTKP